RRNGDEDVRNRQCHFGRAVRAVGQEPDRDRNRGRNRNRNNHNQHVRTGQCQQMFPAKAKVIKKLTHAFAWFSGFARDLMIATTSPDEATTEPRRTTCRTSVKAATSCTADSSDTVVPLSARELSIATSLLNSV